MTEKTEIVFDAPMTGVDGHWLKRPLTEAVARWDPEKHPRAPAGSPAGGEFASKGGAYAPAEMRGPSPAEVTFLARIKDDPRIAEVRRHIEQSPKTVNQFKRPDGSYVPERAALHEQVVASMDTGTTPPKGEKPVLSLLLGLPASGKTKQIRPLVGLLGQSTVVDPDAVKDRLPEYASGRMQADSVHQESADVSVQLMRRAIQNRHHVVLDVTGKNYDSTLRTVKAFTDGGYEVDVYHVTVPPLVAAERAVGRFKEERRFVDPTYIINEVGVRSDVTYDKLKGTGLLRSWRSYDNDVPRGTPARLRDRGDR